MLEGILIGGAGGTIAGLAIWVIQWLMEKVTERVDKKNKFLSQRTKLRRLSDTHLDDLQYRISTIDIGVSHLSPSYFIRFLITKSRKNRKPYIDFSFCMYRGKNILQELIKKKKQFPSVAPEGIICRH
ncbi:hypothetical protein C5S31_01595 [ANME-1 cluster archaeon GoMg2]|nr:hypothetical protein [ANME-1 cluster archaeon GoMg2]